MANNGYTNEPPHTEIRSLDEALRPPGVRIADHLMVGQAVGGGKVGDIVSGNPASTNLGTGVSSGTVSIADGVTQLITFTVTDPYNRVILAVPDASVFANGIGSAFAWPNASFGPSNLSVTIFNDWALTNNVNTVTKVVVRNTSGSSVDVTAIVRWRIITNSTAALTGLSSGSTSQ